MTWASFLGGATCVLVGRFLLLRGLLAKFRRDIRRLNHGDHHALLAAYAEDAELRFNEGPHRWSGVHRGRAAIDRFLRNFVHAGLRGELRALWVSGPLWAMAIIARLDDRASDPQGHELFRNRTMLIVCTRWGKVVEQEDFFEDTSRMAVFEQHLARLGVQPVAADPEDCGRA